MNHKIHKLATAASKMRAYRNPMPRYPKFYWSQGTLDEFEPIPASKNKKASNNEQKITQKNLRGQL